MTLLLVGRKVVQNRIIRFADFRNLGKNIKRNPGTGSFYNERLGDKRTNLCARLCSSAIDLLHQAINQCSGTNSKCFKNHKQQNIMNKDILCIFLQKYFHPKKILLVN